MKDITWQGWVFLVAAGLVWAVMSIAAGWLAGQVLDYFSGR